MTCEPVPEWVWRWDVDPIRPPETDDEPWPVPSGANDGGVLAKYAGPWSRAVVFVLVALVAVGLLRRSRNG